MVRLVFFMAAFFIVLASGTALGCTVSISAVSFANYIAGQSSPVDGTGAVTANCANGTPYSISLNWGNNGAPPNRKMNSGGSYLDYNLYLDFSRVQIWGDGTSGSSTVGDTGNGLDQSHAIYGRIPGNQSPTPGSYGDTINVTVSY